MKSSIVRRITLFALAIASFVATEVGRFVYRPWVRRSGFDDLGLADGVGSLGGAMTCIFLFTALLASRRRGPVGLVIGLGMGCVLYEFLQPLLGTGIFDWSDVIAVLVGSIIGAISISLIWSQFPDPINISKEPNQALQTSPLFTLHRKIKQQGLIVDVFQKKVAEFKIRVATGVASDEDILLSLGQMPRSLLRLG